MQMPRSSAWRSRCAAAEHLPHHATPATAYTARPKASPGDRRADTYDRVRRDRIYTNGVVTCVTAAASTTSAPAGPTPEPTSCCSFRTGTSGSSTPPPANCSANSPSTQTATTSPPENPSGPPSTTHQAPTPVTDDPEPVPWVRGHSDVLRHHMERVTGNRTRTVSLGIRQIAADQADEQPIWETGSSRD